MPNTLMILAHPKIEESIGNKTISESISKLDNVTVRDLTQLYPAFKIDIEAEQKALLIADIIVFQYPLFWYNVPAILKEWIDKVFQYGFAFGKDSYQLEGKKVVVSFTMGSSIDYYPSEVVEKITYPIRGLAEYCKMEYLGEVLSNDINNNSDAKEKTLEIVNKHTSQLTSIIQKIKF